MMMLNVMMMAWKDSRPHEARQKNMIRACTYRYVHVTLYGKILSTKSRTSLESLCGAKNVRAHKQKPLCDSKRTTLTAPLHKLEAQDCA